MSTYVKGSAVANATKYDLKEKLSDGTYKTLVEDASEINFEVSALGLAAGSHTLVVVAQGDGYADSDPSNEVVYTVGEGGSTGDSSGGSTDAGSGDSGNTGGSTVPSGTNYYTNKGYAAVSNGAITGDTSTWIHSDMIPIDSLANDADTGYCAATFVGHASVAAVAYYSSDDFSDYISGYIASAFGGVTATVEQVKSKAPDNATHVVFSTNGATQQLYVCTV